MKKLIPLLFVLFLVTGCGSERDVTISKPSGTYYGEQHVTITCNDPTAQILYTLDGSDPGESTLVYDNETGININFDSTLKATAGGNVATAEYVIIPYTSEKDEAQKEFFDKIQGTWSTSADAQDNFIIGNSTVKFQLTGTPELTSGYLLKDIDGNSATLLYTDAEGNNVEVPITVDPDNHTVTVNDKTYTSLVYLKYS